MKLKPTLRPILAGIGAAVIALSSASAQVNGSWNVDSNGDWSDAANWTSDPDIPGGAGSTVGLDFDITGDRTVTIDGTSRTVGTLNIGLTGNTRRWTLNANGGASLTFDNNGNGAVLNFIDGPNASQAGFTGTSEISAPITLADNLSIDSAKLLRISGVISESGGARSITVNGGLILEGENTFTGGVTLESGDLRFTNAGKDANNVVYSLGSGTLTVEGGQLGFQHGQTHIIENEVVLKGNFNAYRGVTGTTTWQQDGDVTLEANVRANSPNGTMNWVVNGSISGDHSLEISGNTMNTNLNAANTFSGGFIHNASGTLRINHAQALGTGKLTIQGNRTIDNTSGSAITITNTNDVDLKGNLTFTGSNDLNMGAGAIKLDGGNRTVTVTAGTLTFGGAVGQDSGSRQLIKAGDGTLVLGGANTYLGATSVNAGALIINGNASSATGAVTVGAAGTLGGSGTVGGATTINGALNPGNSTGVLNFGNTLVLGSGSTTTMEILGLNRGSQYDGVDVTDALTYGGNLILDFGTLFGVGSHDFNLFDFGSESGSFSAVSLAGEYSGSLVNDGFGVWGLSVGDNTWSFAQDTGDLNLTVIPEPRAALLGSIGLLLLLRRRR